MKFDWKTCFKICLSIFILYLCIHYLESVQNLLIMILSAASPLLIGCVIAYPVNILMSFYEKHYFPKTKNRRLISSRRPVCMVGAFLSLLAIIILIISLVVPQLISCVRLVAAELPDTIKYLINSSEKLGIVPENIVDVLSGIDWRSRIGNIVEAFTSGFGNVMDMAVKMVTSVFSGIVTTLLAVIFAIYLLGSKDRLGLQLRKISAKYVSERIRRKTSYFISVLDDCFHSYVVGQCLEAVILGCMCIAGMLILRLPYAVMIGTLVGFTALIPIAGAYVGAIVGAFMIITISPLKALIFLIFIVILQQLEGNLVYPKIVGTSIGLPGIWVLAAVTVGGGIMGVVGMLLGVPLTACIYRIIRDDVNHSTIIRTATK